MNGERITYTPLKLKVKEIIRPGMERYRKQRFFETKAGKITKYFCLAATIISLAASYARNGSENKQTSAEKEAEIMRKRMTTHTIYIIPQKQYEKMQAVKNRGLRI